MTVKSEVQGIVQALFGAYAGGYLVELTAEATANGTGAVAARLASVQGIILGKDLSTNASFVDTILFNMGVPSTNAAYAAASKWATDELTAGASRADVVSAAVAFLSGIAAGTIVDTKYAAIATAFAAKVTAGVTYSETAAGAKVLSVTALQTAAGYAAPTKLVDLLDANDAAKKALADFLKAQKDNLSTTTVDESIVDDVLAAAINKVNNAFSLNNTDAQNAAARSVAIADADAVVAAADAKLAALQKIVSGVTGLASKFSTYESLVAAATAATKAATAAIAANADAETLLLSHTAAADDELNSDATVETGGVEIDGGPNLIVWNSVTQAFQVDTAITTAAAAASATPAQKLLAADTAVLLTAFNAMIAANATKVSADAAVALSLTVVDDFDTAIQTASTASTTSLDNGATSAANLNTEIVAAKTAQAEAVNAKATLTKDLAALDAALALVESRDALDDAVVATAADIEKAGFTVETTGQQAVFGTSGDDVFLVGADGTINLFNVLGNDVLYVGTKYTLNTGKFATDGDDAVLEAFISKDAAGSVVITLEIEKYSSSTPADDEIAITLTGVALADVQLANGFIQNA